ncbi:MAG: PIG-L deacetylase family protein [Bacilli bacterium]
MEIYYPQNRKEGKVKYLAISAHQDDVEIMAYHGISKGYRSKKYSFAAIVTADGSGSSRTNEYKDYTDEMMKKVRIDEQKAASEIGRYHSLYLLKHPSSQIKDKNDEEIINEYMSIIEELDPEIIYTHNILDKHPTHLGVVIKVIEALRRLNKKCHVKHLYGMEVWRDLDWANDEDKLAFDVSNNKKLQKDILNVFKSQIVGGKRYDLATIGRRYANATYAKSHSVDTMNMISFGIDLTPLIKNQQLSILDFATKIINNFKSSAINELENLL